MTRTVTRPATEADFPALRRLVASREGHSDQDVEARMASMAWIAFNNPNSDGGPTYFVASRGDDIVAYLGRMPVKLTTGSGTLQTAGFVHDLYVSPGERERGMGFFLAMGLYKAVEDATPGLLVGLWPNEVNLELIKRRAYDIIEHPQYIKVLDPERFIGRAIDWRLLRRLVTLLISVVLRVMEVRPRLSPVAPADIEETPRFDARHDALAAELRGSMGRRSYPDSALLNWRYVDLPGADSRIYSIGMADRVDGYIVTRLADDGVGRIVDLQCELGEPRLIARLLWVGIDKLRASGANSIACFATDPRLVSMLARFWFFESNRSVPIAFRNSMTLVEPEPMAELSEWHLGFGESDFVMFLS